MRIGRIVKSVDILFSTPHRSSIVSAGGVVLSRRGDDDYVRFRVPDTQCPPLPRPNEPLDDGAAENAEPGRWFILRGDKERTQNQWLLRAQEQEPGNEEIRLSYTVFPDDFHIEFRVELVNSGGSYGYGNGHGVGVEIWKDSQNFIRAGAGRFWTGAFVGMWGGLIGGSSIFYEVAFIVTGSSVYIQLRRVAGSVAVRFSNDGVNWAAWRTLGTLTGELRMSVRGFMVSLYGQPAGNAWADCRFHYLTTISGAPSSVTVTTPVIDMQQPVSVTPSHYPAVGTLEWRASNSPFGQNDSTPAWNNPVGEYRYWQARVTWTSPGQLLERIEFSVPLLRLEFVMLRNRFIWQAHTDQNPVVVPFKPIAFSHRVHNIQQVAGGYQVTFAEQADEYWLLLQE